MKINLKRQTKTYRAGDEVTLQIMEAKEANNKLSLKMAIVSDGKPSKVLVYKTFDPFSDTGARYYFEELLNALNAPEDGDIDLKWFVKKRFGVILSEREWQGRAYLDIGSYVEDDGTENGTGLPWDGENDLDNDEDFMTNEPKKKTKNKKTVNEETPARDDDYTKLLDE